MPKSRAAQRQRIVANIGCGPHGSSPLPDYFTSWKQLRVDADPAVEPDIVADLTDLSPLDDDSVDAVWASHCLEHLYIHQVPRALNELHRVMADHAFAALRVPDMQAVAAFFTNDRPHEPIYHSPAGPISAHDMFYGHGDAIARGREFMAHRCGFTPALLQKVARETPFVEAVIRRNPKRLELGLLLRKTSPAPQAERDELIERLGL